MRSTSGSPGASHVGGVIPHLLVLPLFDVETERGTFGHPPGDGFTDQLFEDGIAGVHLPPRFLLGRDDDGQDHSRVELRYFVVGPNMESSARDVDPPYFFAFVFVGLWCGRVSPFKNCHVSPVSVPILTQPAWPWRSGDVC